MSDKLVIVENIYMKRVDSWIAFNHKFIQECNSGNIKVKLVLPKEPCALVKDKFSSLNLDYIIVRNWIDVKDENRIHRLPLIITILKLLITEKVNLISFHFLDEISVIVISVISKLLFCRPKMVWHQHSEIKPITANNSIKNVFSKIRILSLLIDLLCPVYKGQEIVLRQRKVNQNKLCTIYNGINLQQYDFGSNSSAPQWFSQIADDDRVIINISSLIPRKGLEYSLLALKNVVPLIPNIKLIVVGEGPLLDDLLGLAQKLNISKNVIFAGKRSDVNQLLRFSEVFILTALSEAFPLSILEAMASGIPVVASNVAGIPEAVTHGENGFLVEPGDVPLISRYIVELLTNKDLQYKMGQRGKDIVKAKFSLEKMVEQYSSCYSKLLR